jgi:hypothetical protein
VAGCSAGSAGTNYDSAQAVAKAAGCGGYQQDDQTTLFAADTGVCRYHGHYVSIDWFKDGTSLDNYRTVADCARTHIGMSVP